MKTSELIKQAEQVLEDLDESQWYHALSCFQELISKLKKYESALKTIGEFNNEDFSDPSVEMASFARKALGDK